MKSGNDENCSERVGCLSVSPMKSREHCAGTFEPPPSPSFLLHLVGALVLFASVGVERAAAQESAASDVAPTVSIPRARALFEAGSVAVEEGDYENAFRYFTESYELSAEPRMLFNLGSCSERMQRSEDALGFYRQFLAEVPEAQNRQFVEGRIRALEAVIAESEAQSQAQSQAQAQAQAEAIEAQRALDGGSAPLGHDGEPQGTPASAWVLLGGGVAAVVGGGVLLATGAAKRAELDDAPEGAPFAEFDGHASSANLQTGLGIGLLAAGALSATVGLVIMVSSGSNEDDTQVVLGVNRVSVRGSF